MGGFLGVCWWVGALVISAGDTMKVTRQKDLIAPFLSSVIWDSFSVPQCRSSVSQQFAAVFPLFLHFFLLLPFFKNIFLFACPGAVYVADLKIKPCLTQDRAGGRGRER